MPRKKTIRKNPRDTSKPPPGPDVRNFPPIFGDPIGDVCRAFRRSHADIPFSRLDPLYAIPSGLINAITKHLSGWLTAEEVAFERDLASFCEQHHAVGIAEDTVVSDCLVNPQDVSAADVAQGSWAARPPTDPAGPAKQLAARLRPLLDGRLEYLGWLLTHPKYLRERDVIRGLRQQRGLRVSFLTTWDPAPDTLFQGFLDHWMVSGLLSWELPVPQGSNLTGAAWPRSILENKPHATVEIPMTMRIKARDPIHQVLDETLHHNVPEHLLPWVNLPAKSASAYSEIFRLHFYRNLVIGSRYGPRFKGNVDGLDAALGASLCLSVDAIRKYRQQIRRRLGSDDPAQAIQTLPH